MEAVFDARAMIRRGVVIAVDDSGPAQLVTVRTGPGSIYSGIEVIQPFGSANVPPVNGAIAVVLCLGGDPANMVALLSNPSRRLAGMAPGEQAIYGRGGTRVAIRNGGTVEIKAAAAVIIAAPSATIVSTGTVSVTAPVVIVNGMTITAGGITFAGDLHITGNIHASGTIGH